MVAWCRRGGWLALVLATLSGCSLAPKSFKGVKNDAPLVRARAIPLGRKLPDRAVVPELIEHLSDRDQVVRLAAYEELHKRTGQDFGFVPYADEAERARAVAKWRVWWQSKASPTLRDRRRHPLIEQAQVATGPDLRRVRP